jgi:hypothetical protein
VEAEGAERLPDRRVSLGERGGPMVAACAMTSAVVGRWVGEGGKERLVEDCNSVRTDLETEFEFLIAVFQVRIYSSSSSVASCSWICRNDVCSDLGVRIKCAGSTPVS